MLLLFDFTAAFDTVNHNLLLAKLFENFGFADNALKWFSTYLENRSYYVKGVDDSVSHVLKVTSGVPQSSILGPVLFNLYFKDAEMIAKSHGFSVHSYADDMQCYFELGKNISIDFVSDKITSFLLALKNWMTSNPLKLNKNKTKVIELLPASHNVNARLVTDLYIDSSCALILPTSYVKNLGVIFDAKLNMEKHVHKVVSTCYANLRNLGRIASKLSIDLKIQLVHSMILSHIDYCNAFFYDLPEMLLKKLTKVLYAGVRFIFGLHGTASRLHMLPFLKRLHILPIKFRTEFKIALLTHKCLHGNAPAYLRKLICPRFASTHYCLRVNHDKWLLQTMPHPSLVKSKSMFSFAAPKIWNSLPLPRREISSVSLFKTHLKSYFFNIAFEDAASIE